jgi:hypothetical protein
MLREAEHPGSPVIELRLRNPPAFVPGSDFWQADIPISDFAPQSRPPLSISLSGAYKSNLEVRLGSGIAFPVASRGTRQGAILRFSMDKRNETL